jgi:uncharacterized membrane protein
MCVVAIIVIWVLSVVASLPANGVQLAIENGAFDRQALPLFRLLHIALALAAVVFQLYLATGQTIFFLKVARRQPASLGDLFAGGPFLLRMLGNTLVFVIAMYIGLILCIVPGFLIALMYWPYAYVLVDQDPPGIGALTRSKEITSGNWIAVILLALASLGFQILGLLACVVGLLFTTPFVMLLFAVAYCRMTGQLSE